MRLEYVPLLQTQHALYQLPRGFERFQEYLRTMIDTSTGDLKLPLAAMNPMGKEHVPAFIEQLLAMNTDTVAKDAIEQAGETLHNEPGAYKVGLVVSDDLKGGWTNRYAAEFDYRFQPQAYYKRGWIVAILWTSEIYTPELICEEVLAGVFRAVYARHNGRAHTLREMLVQEGYAMRNANATTPKLESEDFVYTREVLAPYLERTDQPTIIAALFGDGAAQQLGYPPLGLSSRAGLALALAETKMAH